jgi:hypothetical protein
VGDRKRESLQPEKAGAPKGSGLCHDATPWTQLNRVPLCQATLSIGPYLLLKVQFQRYFSFPNSPDSKPGVAHQKLRGYPTEREAGPRDVYSRVYEKSWKVSSPALMPATSLATGDTYRTGPRADSPPNRRYHFAQRAGTPERCPGPPRLEQPQQQYYQDDYYYDAYYQAQLIAPHPFTSFTVVDCSLSSYKSLGASTRSPASPYPCRSHRSIHR